MRHIPCSCIHLVSWRIPNPYFQYHLFIQAPRTQNVSQSLQFKFLKSIISTNELSTYAHPQKTSHPNYCVLSGAITISWAINASVILNHHFPLFSVFIQSWKFIDLSFKLLHIHITFYIYTVIFLVQHLNRLPWIAVSLLTDLPPLSCFRVGRLSNISVIKHNSQVIAPNHCLWRLVLGSKTLLDHTVCGHLPPFICNKKFYLEVSLKTSVSPHNLWLIKISTNSNSSELLQNIEFMWPKLSII